MNLSTTQQQMLGDQLSTSDDNDPTGLDQIELSTVEESQEDSLACSDLQNHSMSTEDCDDNSVDFSLPFKQVLFSLNRVICQRLDQVETRLDSINSFCLNLGEKVEHMANAIKLHNAQTITDDKQSGHTVVVGIPQTYPVSSDDEQSSNAHRRNASGPNIQLLTLNSEADYPNGSWLGNEKNPEIRVRCNISPTDLFHINATCHTAEKMALTLLDYLFTRETQATSNISGTGKHKKKQLDPLLIYGIRCHLSTKFGIMEKDWHRIRQNMDSKCRTAYRRKMKGWSRAKQNESQNVVTPSDDVQDALLQSTSMSDLGADHNSTDADGLDPSQVLTLHSDSLSLASHANFASIVNSSQVFHTPQGDIQVVHATPEQLAEIQQSHQIQILSGDQVLSTNSIIQPVLQETLDNLQHVANLESKKE